MIRNICFDIGNVLIDFQPGKYFKDKNIEVSKREEIISEIFESEEWRMLDNGDISFEEAYDRIKSHSSLTKEDIIWVFDCLPDLLRPLETNIKLLPQLKEKGYKLYYISNFTVRYFYYIRELYSFFGIFDGGEISGDLHQSKPGKEIFRTIFERYSIEPAESVFIDDIEENIKTAGSLGMTTIHLKYGDNLKKRFSDLGIL